MVLRNDAIDDGNMMEANRCQNHVDRIRSCIGKKLDEATALILQVGCHIGCCYCQEADMLPTGSSTGNDYMYSISDSGLLIHEKLDDITFALWVNNTQNLRMSSKGLEYPSGMSCSLPKALVLTPIAHRMAYVRAYYSVVSC